MKCVVRNKSNLSVLSIILQTSTQTKKYERPITECLGAFLKRVNKHYPLLSNTKKASVVDGFGTLVAAEENLCNALIPANFLVLNDEKLKILLNPSTIDLVKISGPAIPGL